MRPDQPRARRQLADRLAAIRTAAGVRVRALGDELGIDPGEVSRIARGQRLPTLTLVEAWLSACSVTDPGERREVVDLAKEAHRSDRSWRAAMRGGSVQHLERERLDASTVVSSYQPVRVPGLLQTYDYARLVLRALGAPGTNAERSAHERIENQSALTTPGRRFRFVIGERVLARDYGHPRLLTEQRAAIDERDALDSVEVYVLPDSALVPEVPFTIYDAPPPGVSADPLVTIEGPIRGHVIETPEDVDAYRDLFARLRHAARPL